MAGDEWEYVTPGQQSQAAADDGWDYEPPAGGRTTKTPLFGLSPSEIDAVARQRSADEAARRGMLSSLYDAIESRRRFGVGQEWKEKTFKEQKRQFGASLSESKASRLATEQRFTENQKWKKSEHERGEEAFKLEKEERLLRIRKLQEEVENPTPEAALKPAEVRKRAAGARDAYANLVGAETVRVGRKLKPAPVNEANIFYFNKLAGDEYNEAFIYQGVKEVPTSWRDIEVWTGWEDPEEEVLIDRINLGADTPASIRRNLELAGKPVNPHTFNNALKVGLAMGKYSKMELEKEEEKKK